MMSIIVSNAVPSVPADPWLRTPLGAHGMIRDWLLDPGSLTSRVKAVCTNFRVRVVRQGRISGWLDEAPLFGARRGRLLLGRDVVLIGDDVPVVFAHSVLLADDLRGTWHAIGSMGTKPLGAALFADPRIERRPLHYRKLHEGHPLYFAAQAALGVRLPEVWARRSLFCLRGAPLLVTEVFLPGFAGLRHSNRRR